MNKKYKLKKDIVIKAGTIFECIDGRKTEYMNDNFSTNFNLSKDSFGEIIYGGIDDDFDNLTEWFEEVGE